MTKIYRRGSGKVFSTIPIKGSHPVIDDCHCVICGQEVVGSYYYDNYGNKACSCHGDYIRRCKDCDRILAKEEGVHLDDGQWLCDICDGCAVKDEAAASYLFHELIDEYRVIGITGFDENTAIRLVTKSEGWSGQTRTVFNGNSYSFEIYMLSPSHPLVFKSTLAHEMLHTWLVIHNIDMESSGMEEGFCNLGSAWVLEKSHSKIGNMWLDLMEKDYDLRYGQGFRVMRNRLKKLGWKGLIESLKP